MMQRVAHVKLDPGAFLRIAKLGKTAKGVPKRLESLLMIPRFGMSEADAIQVVRYAPAIVDLLVKFAGLFQIRESLRIVAFVLINPRDVVQDVCNTDVV